MWTGNQVKDSKHKVSHSIEDGIETGPTEALIILVLKWARNMLMTSFLTIPEAVSVEPTSKGRRVDEKSQNLEVVAEKSKINLYVGR